MSGGDLPIARLLGGSAIPDHVASDAVLDHQNALLGNALEVECLRVVVRVETLIPESEAFVEELLAEPPGQIAASLEERERVERCEGEVEEELRDRVRLEHRAEGLRLDRRRAVGPLGLLGRLVRDGCRIEV